jgi:hypothetical protein
MKNHWPKEIRQVEPTAVGDPAKWQAKYANARLALEFFADDVERIALNHQMHTETARELRRLVRLARLAVKR